MLLITRHTTPAILTPDDETSSFVIRSPLGGSSLRDPSSSTNRLRNDPELAPGVLAQLISGSHLSAVAASYSSAQLVWSAPSFVSGWTDLLITSSTTGSPVTPLTGRSVISVVSTDPTVSYVDTGLSSGYWRYYSMFLRVPASNPQYLLVARTDVLLPARLGWDEQMWEGTPGWYRRLDIEQGGNSDGPLRRFYSLLGFEMDLSVTYADGIKDIYDIDTAPERFLPSIAHQLGVPVEPDIGGDRFRSYIANYSEITRLKATSAGIYLLTKSITGCESSVSVGKNLLLSEQDSNGMLYDGVNASLGIGGWNGDDSNSLVANGLSGAGYLRATAVASGSINVSDNVNNSFYAGVPVKQGLPYTYSVFVRTAVTGRVCTMAINWYGNEGVFISTSTASTFTDTLGGGTHSFTATSPDGAVYAVPRLSWAGCSASEEHQFINVQVEQAPAFTSYEHPRLITLTVQSRRINLCINPSFAGTLAAAPGDWTFVNGTAAVTTDADAVSGTTVCVATAIADGDVLVSNGAPWPADGGVVYSWNVSAKAQDSGLATASVLWHDASGILLGTSTSVPVATASGSFLALSGQAVAPASTVSGRLQVNFESVLSGRTVTLDACLIEQGTIGPYFDGDSANGGASDFEWEGAQFSSRSHYLPNRLAVLSRLTAALGDYMPAGSNWAVATNAPPS